MHGVELQLNGSLGGHVGHKHFFEVKNPKIVIKEQSNLSDMTEKIKSIERIHPNYMVGMQQKQNDIDKKEEAKKQEKQDFVSRVRN